MGTGLEIPISGTEEWRRYFTSFIITHIYINPLIIPIILTLGAFLIPYFIMLCVEGIPVFYLELAIGQRLRKGAIGAWNLISVYAGGIGLASAVVSFNVALYYNTIIAWCIFYFYHSFKSPLPWSDCPPKKLINESYVSQPECEVSCTQLTTITTIAFISLMCLSNHYLNIYCLLNV